MAKKHSKKFQHKSFRRSYREDYRQDVEMPGVISYIGKTIVLLVKNFKLFFGLMIIAVVLDLVLVGFWGEAEVVMTVLVLAMVWLVTLFLLRHLMARRKVKLRDGLYNAMTPLVPTLVLVVVATIQCVPIFLLTMAYSAAIETEFLTMPFYALIFFVFASLMVLLSGYLLSSTLMALVAVSAPGLYPMKALELTSEMMMGRKIRFVLRLIALVIFIIAIWAVVILPTASLEAWLKTFEWAEWLNLTGVVAMILACFTVEYVAAYLYVFYKKMIK